MIKISRSNSRTSLSKALPYVTLLTAIGILIVYKGMAAGTPAAFEVESGTLTGGATLTSHIGASNGKVVRFGTELTPIPSAIWTGDYETGSLSQFIDSTWNNQPTAPALTTTRVRGGTYAGKYSIPAYGIRSENVPNTASYNRNDDRWFTWSTYLENVQLNTTEWQVITQWKNDGIGSPPISLSINNGIYKLEGGWGWPGNTESISPKLSSQVLGNAANGVWDDWMFHIKFHDDPAISYVDVWRNGAQIVSGWHPPGGTLYPGVNGNGLFSYLKIGYYRSDQIPVSSNIYQDNWKVGATRESVSN